MTAAIICVIIGFCVLAYLSRAARLTGAAVRDWQEEFFNWHEMGEMKGWFREPEFYTQRKWEVKVD